MLIIWKGLLVEVVSWEPLSTMRRAFPAFDLEVKANLEEGGGDMSLKRL